MTSVEKTPYSLKNYKEINYYYNDYLRTLHVNDSENNYTILNSIYPPLKNNNSQILFMPFLKEFIKGEHIFEFNTANLESPTEATPNFINYLIADNIDQDDVAEDDEAKRQINAQKLYMTNSKNEKSFLANYKKIEDDIDESEETKATKATKATKVKKGQQILNTLKDKTKNILNGIKDQFKDNHKLTIKQAAAAAAAEQKLKLAEEKAAAEIAITVFDYGLLSFETDYRDKFVIPPNLYSDPSAVALYDSLHDFGYEICDTETDKKGKENYGYSKFMFTYLLYGGYPELNTEQFSLQNFQVNYSYLKAYTRPISPEGLENYFVIGNMYNIVKGEPSLEQRIEYYKKNLSLPKELQDTTRGDLQIVINTKLNYLRSRDNLFVVENPTLKNLVKVKTTSPITDDTYNTLNNRAQKQIDIYDYLAVFFAEYSDPNFADGQVSLDDQESKGKIKLCIDFQSNLNKIMRKNKTKKKFCLLYTAETITDSASKSKAQAVDETFGVENWYIEALHNPNEQDYRVRGHYGGPEIVRDIEFVNEVTGRTDNVILDYKNGDIKVHSVKGNISVKYNSIQYSDPNDLQKADYTVNLEYYFKNIPVIIERDDITMNKKQTAKTAVTTKVNNFVENVKKNFNFTKNVTSGINTIINSIKNLFAKSTLLDRNNFYNLFNENIINNNSVDMGDLYKEYALYYAIKRLGDTLQAEVCRYFNLQHMLFYSVKKNESNKYEVNFNIKIPPKKGAVLVTHDRMLFAYAVINNIPAILDMENHMIIFKPKTDGTDGTDGSIEVVSKNVSGGKVVINTSSTFNKGELINNTQTSTQTSTRNGGSIQTGGEGIDDLVKDIFSNIDAIMRYLYFRRNLGSIQDQISSNREDYGTKNIAYFLEIVCELLYNENSVNNVYDNEDYLHIEYITNYKYNVLLIGTPDFINIVTTEIEVAADDTKLEDDDDDLLEVNTFIYIYISDQNFLRITRDYQDGTKVINLNFMYNGTRTRTLGGTGYGFINPTSPETNNIPGRDEMHNGHQFNEWNIKKSLSRIDLDIYDSYIETLRIIEDSGANYLVEEEEEEEEGVKEAKGGAPNDDEKDNKSDKSSYQEILGADFGKLNNTEKLLQNNITVLTYLHQLLREYELSFINYEEGIDTFYCKIDESVQLSYTIGLHNFMPRDYDFYVFLTFLIRDYKTETITTINFALFEYYLYMTKEENDIYFNYLTIKSYLLDISYQVSMTEEIKEKLTSGQNIATYEYFKTLMEKVTETSYTITELIYLDIQTKNTDYKVTYKNIDEYNLKLRGFSDLQEEFTDKTLKIIGDLVKAKSPLILEFVEKAKAQQTLKEGEEVKVDEVDEEFVKVVPYDDDNVEQVVPTDILITKYDETDNNNVKQVVPTGKEEENIGRGLIERYNPLKDDIAPGAAGGKKHKLSKNKYRKEKNKTKRKRTKRQGTKRQVNQTKKNRKIKKKRNTKRNKE